MPGDLPNPGTEPLSLASAALPGRLPTTVLYIHKVNHLTIQLNGKRQWKMSSTILQTHVSNFRLLTVEKSPFAFPYD